jgi:hypothetical protein
MEKGDILKLFAQARRRAESGDLGIANQHVVISDVERQGLSSTKARALLAKLITARDLDLTEMERLLDEMDGNSD